MSKEFDVLAASLQKEVELGYKTREQADSELFQIIYNDNQALNASQPSLDEYQASIREMDTLGGRLENTWERFASGARGVLSRAAQTPYAGMEYITDLLQPEQGSYLEAFNQEAAKKTDSIQEWGKAWEGNVNRTLDEQYRQEIIEPGFNAAKQEWDQGNELNAAIEYAKTIAEYGINDPLQAVELLAESLPDIAATMVAPILSFIGYSTEKVDNAVEQVEAATGQPATLRQLAESGVLGTTAGAAAALSDKFVGSAIKNLATAPIKGTGAISGLARGGTLAATDMALEGIFEGTEQALDIAAAKPEDRFNYTVDEAKEIFESGVLGSVATAPISAAQVTKDTIGAIQNKRDEVKATNIVNAFKQSLQASQETSEETPSEDTNESVEEPTKLFKSPTEGFRKVQEQVKNINENSTEEDLLNIKEDVLGTIDTIIANPKGNIKTIAKGLGTVIEELGIEIPSDKKDLITELSGTSNTANIIKKAANVLSFKSKEVKEFNKVLHDSILSLEEEPDLNKQLELVKDYKAAALVNKVKAIDIGDSKLRKVIDLAIEELTNLEDTISRRILSRSGASVPVQDNDTLAKAHTNLKSNSSENTDTDKKTILTSLRLGSFPFNEQQIDELLSNTELAKDDSFVTQLNEYKKALTYREVATEIMSGKDPKWLGYKTHISNLNAYMAANNKQEASKSLQSLNNITEYQELKLQALKDVRDFNGDKSNKQDPDTLTNVKKDQFGNIVEFKVLNPFDFEKGRDGKEHTFYFKTQGQINSLINTVENEVNAMRPLLNLNKRAYQDTFNITPSEASVEPSKAQPEATPTTGTTKLTESPTNLIETPTWDTSRSTSPVFTDDGKIDVIRKKNTTEHFGNPFTSERSGGKGTIDEVSNRYVTWLKGETDQEVEPERRKWIVNQIAEGNLDNKPFIYYKSNAQQAAVTAEAAKTNHAKELAKLVEDKSWIPSEALTSNSSSTFKGYKGGFSNTGKGTVTGDSKDREMRAIADGFIGESVTPVSTEMNASLKDFTSKSSTDTSFKEIGTKYGSPTEYGAKDVYRTSGNNDAKVVMLARNKKLRGTPLHNHTKTEILRSKDNGSTFIVGDMPNVDTQFIEYLIEIDATFTVYHSGKNPRIDVNALLQSKATGNITSNTEAPTSSIQPSQQATPTPSTTQATEAPVGSPMDSEQPPIDMYENMYPQGDYQESPYDEEYGSTQPEPINTATTTNTAIRVDGMLHDIDQSIRIIDGMLEEINKFRGCK